MWGCGGILAVCGPVDSKQGDDAGTENWSYLTDKNGEQGYEKVYTYRFVGEGRGDFDFDARPIGSSPEAGQTAAQERFAVLKWGLLCMGASGLIAVCLISTLLIFTGTKIPEEPVEGRGASSQVLLSPTLSPGVGAAVDGQKRPPLFNCEVGYEVSRSSWSPAKRTYCCMTVRRGCSTERSGVPAAAPMVPAGLPGAAAVAAAAGLGPLRSFDCSATSVAQQQDWSFARRKWCCIHKETGCPPGLTPGSGAPVAGPAGVAAAAGIAPAAGPFPAAGRAPAVAAVVGCSATCSIDGLSRTCAAHIRRAASGSRAAGAKACVVAQREVLEHCPACAGCSPAASGCLSTGEVILPALGPAPAPAPEAMSARSSSTTPVPEEGQCGLKCSIDGKERTCKEHAQALASEKYGDQENGCLKATAEMRKQCADTCSRCSAVGAGCSTWTPKAKVQGGHAEKKSAAAAERSAASHATEQGTPANETGSKDLYDCNEGIADFLRIWTDAKKDWCCEHKHRGCPPTVNYDCDVGFSNWEKSWTLYKKAWCCKHHFRGCQFDCDAGYSRWRTGWSPTKQVWCCKHLGKACLEESQEHKD